MQLNTLLHKVLAKSQGIHHKQRLSSVVTAVESVMLGSNLSLTMMGRYMNRAIKPRSKIQTINYLLGNGHLHRERTSLYAAHNTWLCQGMTMHYVLMDWSSLVAHEQHVLRASIVKRGRAMVLYEEIHAEKNLGKSSIHETFLARLATVLPKDINVCIVTDAGFKTDFLKQVEAMGWAYVGRLLTNMHYTSTHKAHWRPCMALYDEATSTPRDKGQVILSKSNQLTTRLYVYKQKKHQASRRKQTVIKYGKKEREQKNAANKPWLIASSLTLPARHIMRIYTTRMKIEHDFRDTKDPVHGLGIKQSRCRDPKRLTLQLLMGMLAAFALWLIGLCLEKKNLHYDFQANSIKHKRVLSLIFLALEAIRSGYLRRLNNEEIMAMACQQKAVECGG